MRRLSANEARVLLKKKGRRRTGAHSMTKWILKWAFCSRCHLIALNNKETRRALRRPCAWESD